MRESWGQITVVRNEEYDGRAGCPGFLQGRLRTSQYRCETREIERNMAKHRFISLLLAQAATALYVYVPVLGKYPCLHPDTLHKRKLKGWENCDICGVLTHQSIHTAISMQILRKINWKYPRMTKLGTLLIN